MRLSSPSGLTGRLLRRSLLGGARRWQVALVVVLTGRLIRRAAKIGSAPVVFSRSLKPGDGVLISHLSIPDRSEAARSGATASGRLPGDNR